MNTVDIETRCGLIIQAIVACGFGRVGISFSEGYKYDPDCETPDFLLPDARTHSIIIECHQTNDRESLKMKILRLMSAVFEAKVFFGKDIVSVNLLFGNIDILPKNNLDSFCSFYDVSFFPDKDKEYSGPIKKIEAHVRKLASNENYDVASAVSEIIKTESALIDILGKYLSKIISSIGSAKENLFPIWEKETARVATIGTSPVIQNSTEYKKSILHSLFLANEDFEELVVKKDPNSCSDHTKDQLLRTGFATVRDSVVRKHSKAGIIDLTSEFNTFVSDPYAMSLRELCKIQIDKDKRIGFFFEDIRNTSRRIAMVNQFIDLLSGDRTKFVNTLYECLLNGTCCGVEHGRCWIADLMPLIVGESHNSFNRRMKSSLNFHQTLGNPYSNIVIRSPRLGNDPEILKEYASVASECFFDAYDTKGISTDSIDAEELANKLFAFRKGAVIKLQTLNPLYIAIESIALKLGLKASYSGVKSVVADMSTGKFDLFSISDGKKSVLVNALYIGPGYGSDHKADEWSGRRRAIGYRMHKGKIVEAPIRDGYVMIVDGNWSPKSIRKLHKAGWNHVCQLGHLESILKEIFSL